MRVRLVRGTLVDAHLQIRQTNVQEGEAGGITQQIGATYFPVDAIKTKTAVLNKVIPNPLMVRCRRAEFGCRYRTGRKNTRYLVFSSSIHLDTSLSQTYGLVAVHCAILPS